MVGCLHLVEDVCYAALFVQKERLASHSHIFAPVHRFLDPYSKGFADGVIGIGKECETQVVLRAEVLMRMYAVGAYSHDAVAALGESRLSVAQTLCLECAS